ncbi:pentatricopeptide repeat-containing protein, putative [Ricinus communis]|uniref:Pentatricopeptide repeat-containing protein, putative n=2 Tax=Ricinus communis TaxID=3988 RepID=B9T027_RICCO|nr:pentatricopeptide repeat-containing protein, putative [Ricinus communis]
MELTKLSTVLNTDTRLGSRNELMGSSLFYSTTPTSSQKWFRERGKDNLNQLYRRISPVGDPKVSIVPILDQWIEEGKSVNKDQLQVFIKELRYCKRYTHALEISMWMSDKRYFALTSRDVAIRLDLMSKVLGIEQAEKYFENVPQKLKVLEVYNALLNCYAYAKSVDKAEAVMQNMRDLGFAGKTLTYNVMLNLHYQTGNFKKLEALMLEMEENGIAYDRFTLGIQLSAYAAICDIQRMEKIMSRMESDANVVTDWCNYAIVANGYRKAGLMDKALEMLKKSEGLITGKKRSSAYNFLLT